jgi:very-short-patch-repair endonuclease
VVRARKLRRNETDAEHKLWTALRDRRLEGTKFVRQYPIGRYVADFVCRDRMLVVEVDGGQHSESGADAARTAFMNARGYSVLRFWNNEILQNLGGCLVALNAVLLGDPSPGERLAPATLSPEGRGAKGAAAATTKHRSYHLTADLPRLTG